MSQHHNLIELLRASLQEGYVPQLQAPCFEELLLLAGQHGISALLYPAVKHQPLPPPVHKLYREEAYSAATRETLQSQALARFFDLCETKEIPVLPLKGCVIKEIYPQPALREMSDVDLLISRKKRRDIATLMAQLGNRPVPIDCDGTDVYESPLGLRYEVHFSLDEDGFNPASKNFCAKLFEQATPQTNKCYVHELPPETHYTYILCHFVKHLLYGGVGIRQLTDLYLWHKHKNTDTARLQSLLQELDLEKLHTTVQTLALHYFEGQPATEATDELGRYLLSSGVFGNEAQRQTDRMLQEGEGVSYYLHRCFPPYSAMRKYFPSLRYLPILLPFYWLWRILRALFFRRKKMKTELELLKTQHNDDLKDRVEFYRRCGLSVYEEKEF